MTSSRHRSLCSGQATVEFALILPVILCTLCLLLDVAWLAVDQCRVNDAARSAARAAIVDADNSTNAARRIVQEMIGEHSKITVSENDGLTTVRVSQSHEFLTPIIGRLLPVIQLRASSTMLIEPRNPVLGD